MNKKKKILFFHFDLQGGGAEKVLVNLLNHLNPDKYDITLQLVFGLGVNMENIPSYVKVKCLFRHQFRGFSRFQRLFTPSFWHNRLIHESYDIEIGYMENFPTRIISACPNRATKLIAWVHTPFDDFEDCIQSFKSMQEAEACYKKFDRIAFVSEESKNVFVKKFCEVKVPMIVLRNINDTKRIIELSKKEIPITLSEETINICSVGRLIPVKGYERLLSVVRDLKQSTQKKFHLYLLGKGPCKEQLEKLIQSYAIEDVVTLLGFDDNPYRYVARMDLFVCSSFKEGFSTAVTESVVLGTPVITTNISGMSEILEKGKYGMIVENDEESLYRGIYQLINDVDMIHAFSEHIKADYQPKTNEIASQYEELFDNLCANAL